jgi:hypothetical protein
MGCNKLPEILSELTNGYANAHRLNQAVGSCHFGSVCGVMLSLNVLGTYAGDVMSGWRPFGNVIVDDVWA